MKKVVKGKKNGQRKNQRPKPDSLLSRRVVKDQDKADKKELIIDCAASLFATEDFAKLSMSAIASKAGLAKGTLYLYFKTKEEIGLEVHRRDYVEWFSALRHSIRQKKVRSARDLAKWVSASLKERLRFLKMLPLGSSILEANVSDEYIQKYKLLLANELQQTAEVLMTFLKNKNVESASLLLVQVHIVVIGAWTHGFPSAKVKKVISDQKLSSLDFDYFDLLEETVYSISHRHFV